MQTISSKETALHQLPALHKSKPVLNHVKSLTESGEFPFILDYGAGKSADLAAPYFTSLNAVYLPYDPFNLSGSEKNLKFHRYDIVLCSNVLNVINCDKAMKYVITNVYGHLAKGGKAFFKVYEGNGSGKGGVTTKGYQRNAPTDFYYWTIRRELQFLARSIEKKGKIIIVTR